MKNDQSLLLLKEKLKTKDREISKLQNFKEEWEGRVKDKITEMSEVIEEQRRIINTRKENPEKTDTEKIDTGKANTAEDGKGESPALLVQLEKEKTINGSLEEENGKLSKNLRDSNKNVEKLNKQLSVLVKEYKRLKDTKGGKNSELMKRLEEGEKSHDAMKKILEKAQAEKDKIKAELNEIQKNPASQEGDSKGGVKLEAAIRIKEGLEKEVNQLSESLEGWRTKAENLLKEKEGVEKLANEFQGDDNAESGENLVEILRDQIAKQKDEAASQKSKADNLVKEVDKLKEEIGKKPVAAPKKESEEDEAGGEEGGAPAWMCTFADMVTLLMVFFVIFYSVNADNTAKMLSVIEGTEDKSVAVGVLEALDEITLKKNLNDMVGLGPGKGQFEFQVEAELKKDLEKAKIDGADVGRDGKKVFVNVPSNNLFSPGSANLTKQAVPVLNKLSQAFLKFTDYQINIAGHTDDVPISTARFPSNWELSSSRATAVLRFFADKGIDPLKMTATGRSDLFPLFSNSTELGRSKNRRVEFVLEKEKKG
tara:strand:- start:75 stop:1691 length:1617 start_codon:yes stop_codon:yes gene_type:complete